MDQDRFQKDLLEALQHLYDSAWLHDHPLLALFPLEDRGNPAASFQRIINEAIQALCPGTQVPSQSNDWRAYNVLLYRFIEGSSQRVVAVNMALSERQLRREEHQAIHRLGDYLWERYSLGKAGDAPENITPVPTAPAGGDESAAAIRASELNWLLESQPRETARLSAVIDSALRVAAALLESAGLKVELEVPEDLPPVTGQVGLLRQALVNLLSAAVDPLGWRSLRITARAEADALVIYFAGDGSGAPVENTPAPSIPEALEMVGELVRLFGGSLLTVPAGVPGVEIRLPGQAGIPILLVDDNADAHQLIQRYLTGSVYRCSGTRSPAEVLALAEEQQPRVVLLDIMLPGRDGWEILAQLRENPRTNRIPVVVCSILPQEQLALSLGAAAFLRKPIMQETLLKTLGSLTGRLSPGPG